MKVKYRIAGMLLVTLGIPLADAYSQGGLIPPGAPAATMKTLDQVEARTPISTATNITQSGSYYLTANIEVGTGDAIVISIDGVKLDLNGFTIRSTNPERWGSGVFINGARRNVVVANGFIESGVTNNGSGFFSGTGFGYGVFSDGNPNISVNGMSVAGCNNGGIFLGDGVGTVVDSCTVQSIGGNGIIASSVKSSLALECGSTAILGKQVSDSRGECVFDGAGISAETVRDSYGYTKHDCGINAMTVQNSYGYAYTSFSTYAYGINAKTVHNCYGYGYSTSGHAIGIEATTVNNSYGYGRSSADDAYGVSAGSSISDCKGESRCDGIGTGYGIFCDGIVHNSHGIGAGDGNGHGYGIRAHAVGNSFGNCGRSSSDSRGIFVPYGSVADSTAYCLPGDAIEAENASNCRGESQSGYGINVNRNAVNCTGITSSGTYGLLADNAQNCYGENSSGSYGLLADNAQNCIGITSSGDYGLYVFSIAIGCSGFNYGSGTGIYGLYLNTCRGYSVSGTSVSYTFKYNMP